MSGRDHAYYFSGAAAAMTGVLFDEGFWIAGAVLWVVSFALGLAPHIANLIKSAR